MADSSIIFDTKLDNSKLEKQLQNTKRDIEGEEKSHAALQKEQTNALKKRDTLYGKLNEKLEKQKAAILKLNKLTEERAVNEKKLNEYSLSADNAAKQLYEMQGAPRGVYTDEQLLEQKETANTFATLHETALGAQKKYNSEIERATIAINQQGDEISKISGDWELARANCDRLGTELTESAAKIDALKEKAGGLEQRLAQAGGNVEAMGKASEKAKRHMVSFSLRLKEVARSSLVFTVISQALAKFRDWGGKVIKTNIEASASIARLKGALLTLAQPLVNVIIPAFTAFVNILTDITVAVANAISILFGSTMEQSARAAESLYNEQNALEGVGSAAQKASKSLAGFDEINKLSGDSSPGGSSASSEIAPDFGAFDEDWLKNTLGETAGMVTTALLLGGIALVAIGACTGNLKAVVAGLLLIGSGIVIGTDTGVLQSWAETLGLNSVGAFVATAFLLAGIALVALGAIFGNLTLVLAGIGFLGSGVVIGKESGALYTWAKTLGLDSVFDYVTAAIQLSGIALIAIGACMANIFMVIAGGGILAAGIAADAIGEKRLSSWWDVLKLTSVQQWVGVALLLMGIGLIAIGAAMGNILMMIAGAGVLAFSSVVNVSDGNLESWVTALGLEKVAGCVTTALLLLGIGLIVFGIVSGNIMMVLAGAGLLGAGILVGATSGTFKTWTDEIIKGLEDTWTTISNWWNTTVSPKLKGINGFFKNNVINPLISGVESFINFFIRGLNWLIEKVNSISFDLPDIMGGGHVGFNLDTLSEIQLPRLAQGAVIPPNREFMAVLGDQKSGTNIEAPLDTIVQAVMIALAKSGYSGNTQTIENILELDGEVIYRNQKKIERRHGVSLANR